MLGRAAELAHEIQQVAQGAEGTFMRRPFRLVDGRAAAQQVRNAEAQRLELRELLDQARVLCKLIPLNWADPADPSRFRVLADPRISSSVKARWISWFSTSPPGGITRTR
jgi:hypothetical protein